MHLNKQGLNTRVLVSRSSGAPATSSDPRCLQLRSKPAACNQQQSCFQGPTAILQYEQREKVQFLASTHQHRHRRLQSCVGVALSLARGNSAPATTHAACRGALMAEPRNPPASARECRCFRTRRSRQDSHYDQTPLVSLQRGSACCRIPRN